MGGASKGSAGTSVTRKAMRAVQRHADPHRAKPSGIPAIVDQDAIHPDARPRMQSWLRSAPFLSPAPQKRQLSTHVLVRLDKGLPVQLFLLAAVSACGGRESSTPFLVDSSPDAVDSGFNAGGNHPDALSDSDQIEAAPTSYIPTAPPPPLEGDGRLADLNGIQGGPTIGFDTCPTSTPGLSRYLPGDSPAPGHGSRYLRFDSSVPCDAGHACYSAYGKAQIAFWFEPPLTAFQAYGLWLEAVSLDDSRPSGALHLVASDGPPCDDSAQSLAIVPLAALELSPVWETRCVPIWPVASVTDIDLYVDSGSFRIGLESLRFGPPCQ